ncbi:hypothetical protein WJX73_008054 [Symbiochloris irregularis]|uniref:Uncharacterized protein n=1 Tax=Symbiochloris irregularis TaxID=706552 RepID=A0AAW1PHM2_9CHLO
MKRTRDDSLGGPAKRPGSAATRGGPSQAGANSRLTTHDALSYLRDVKEKFADNKDIYDTFLEIMKEFKAQRINTEGVIERVKSLFKGHRELILGFNTFLPKGYEITLPPDEEPQKAAVEFDQAINYVNKIKTRFSSDERVYKAFLEILNMYRKGTKTIGNVYEEVALLFRSHNDLLDEFTYFLPDNSTPSQVPQPIRRPANRTGRGPARGGPSQYPDQNAYQRKLNQRKVPGSRMDEYRRYADDVEDRRTAVKTDLTREVSYFDKIKQRIRSREQYQDFLKTLNLYSQEIISRTELNSMIFDILGRNQDLMVGFHEFLNRCEVLDSDADPRMTPGGKVSARDVSRMKGE